MTGEGMRVAVTGAGGFLGGRVLHALIDRPGIEAVAVSRHPVPWLPPVTRRQGSFEEAPDLFAGVDSVVHLAGPNEVAMAGRPDALGPALDLARSVAAACRSAGVRRIVYVSTVHVYGTALAEGAVVDEEVTPEPLTPYASSRLGTERILGDLAAQGAEVIVLRLTNTVGPPADPLVPRWTLVANDLCRQAVTAGALRLNSAGTQFRDFVALDDVCQLIADLVDPACHLTGTFNVGSGQPSTILDVARMVTHSAERAGLGQLPIEAPAPVGPSPTPYIVDISRIRAAGAMLTTPLADAVDETLRFCLTHVHSLPA